MALAAIAILPLALRAQDEHPHCWLCGSDALNTISLTASDKGGAGWAASSRTP